MQCPSAPVKPKLAISRVPRVVDRMRIPGAPMKKKPAAQARKWVTKPPALVFEPAFIQANRERDMAPAGVCPQPPKIVKVARFSTIDSDRLCAATVARVEDFKRKFRNDLRRQVLLSGKPMTFFNNPGTTQISKVFVHTPVSKRLFR